MFDRSRFNRSPLPGFLLAVAAVSMLAGCGDDDDGGGVEFFPPGGVSEEMRGDRSGAKLNLDHTAVSYLEAAGGHRGDTGGEDGVDEFTYHFVNPTQIRLSVGEFEAGAAPSIVVLDKRMTEVGRADDATGEVVLDLTGEHLFRFVHPNAGDATAEPIPFFFQPTVIEIADSEATTSGLQASSGDVATLKAGKDCFRCNLAGLSWNACPGADLAGVNLSHANFTGAVLACQEFQPKGSAPILLTAANFENARLSDVVFKEADLTDATFAGATFDVTTFDSVTATSASFSESVFRNSTFGAASGSGSSARGADFTSLQMVDNSCLSANDLREADFRGASFDSTSSVNSTWFAGANLYDVTFDGTLFKHSSTLPDCGQPASCTSYSVDGLCQDCPCVADLGCLNLAGTTSCVENQGPVTVSPDAVCQRPMVFPEPVGLVLQNADLTGVAFLGADLTNSTIGSNAMDSSTDFMSAVIHGVDFNGQDLGKSVDLSVALLDDTTSFAGAILTDAPATERGIVLSCDSVAQTGGCAFATGTDEFKGADMRYAELDNVALSQADLEGVDFSNASLVGADLSFASLKGADLNGATLGAAPGSGTAASLRGAFMINVDLTDADLRSVDFTDAHLYGATSDALFVRAKLDSADFSNATMADAVFTDASMTDADFNGAQLVNASFEGSTLTNAKFDDAYLQGADFSTAASVTGMSLSNAAVSTNLTSANCMLEPPGTWTYMDQDGTPYTYSYGETLLLTDTSVICPDNVRGPCNNGDSLCPIMDGPFPPVPVCVPVEQYCYENCEDPPCFLDVPDPNTGLCPLVSNCS